MKTLIPQFSFHGNYSDTEALFGSVDRYLTYLNRFKKRDERNRFMNLIGDEIDFITESTLALSDKMTDEHLIDSVDSHIDRLLSMRKSVDQEALKMIHFSLSHPSNISIGTSAKIPVISAFILFFGTTFKHEGLLKEHIDCRRKLEKNIIDKAVEFEGCKDREFVEGKLQEDKKKLTDFLAKNFEYAKRVEDTRTAIWKRAEELGISGMVRAFEKDDIAELETEVEKLEVAKRKM